MFSWPMIFVGMRKLAEIKLKGWTAIEICQCIVLSNPVQAEAPRVMTLMEMPLAVHMRRAIVGLLDHY